MHVGRGVAGACGSFPGGSLRIKTKYEPMTFCVNVALGMSSISSQKGRTCIQILKSVP
jgi:hypothetical protein